MTNIKLSEVFGPTIQGEGKHAGSLAAFIRVFGCPLYCWFCDSAYTWRFNDAHPHKNEVMVDPKEECHVWSFEDIINRIEEMGWPPHIVFTGGEPLIHDEKLYLLGRDLFHRHLAATHEIPHFEIETSGTIEPQHLCHLPGTTWNVSPKLLSSRVALEDRFKPEVLKWFAGAPSSIFKFVITDPMNDIEEIKRIQCVASIPSHKVYLMSEGETRDEQISRFKSVMEVAIVNKWNFSPRLHTLAWGNERGR